MSKGLEALKENKTLIYTFTSGNALIKYGENEVIIEKELKALEIIRRNKMVEFDLEWELDNNLITKEEYDLLKEVLL